MRWGAEVSYRDEVGVVRRATRTCGIASRLVIAGALFAAVSACGSDGDGSQDPPAVTSAEAFTAIIRWEIAEQEPVFDEDGNLELPVMYVASESGATVDIGVQADVVEATADDAVVRFSDASIDSIDEGLEGQPVKDDGVLFVVGAMPSGDARLDVQVRRYVSVDDDKSLRIEIVASDEGAVVFAVVDANSDVN